MTTSRSHCFTVTRFIKPPIPNCVQVASVCFLLSLKEKGKLATEVKLVSCFWNFFENAMTAVSCATRVAPLAVKQKINSEV